MTPKEKLHELVDSLPEGEIVAAQRFLEYLAAAGDPLRKTIAEAPYDDEEETDEERQAVNRARRDIAAGRVIPHEEALRRLGLK